MCRAGYSAGNNPELENAEINSLRGINATGRVLYVVRYYYMYYYMYSTKRSARALGWTWDTRLCAIAFKTSIVIAFTRDVTGDKYLRVTVRWKIASDVCVCVCVYEKGRGERARKCRAEFSRGGLRYPYRLST